jgi:hypothetical protein
MVAFEKRLQNNLLTFKVSRGLFNLPLQLYPQDFTSAIRKALMEMLMITVTSIKWVTT